MENTTHFLSESEICGENIVNKDVFKFNSYAEKIKKLIQLNSNNSEPITIGIYGKWGEGKTSFSNLIKDKIEHFEGKDKKEYLIYNFNPWRYSTEDEILFDFFDGLKKQFYVKDKDNLQIAGEYILKYSKYLKAIKISATVGLPKILNSKIEFSPDKIFEALGEDLKGEEITIEILRNKVNEEIKKKNFKILIFIDDIDRLDDNEIYTLFKLVKLNANFDNFIFILNFDEEQVAKALMKRSGKEIEDGKKYLEKIINIPIHLPKIEENFLEKYFTHQLAVILKNLDLNLEEQQNISSRISFNDYQFTNPRQIKRILNSFYIGAFALNNEVNFTDLFTIEYIKITNLKLYNKLKCINPSRDKNIISRLFADTQEKGFNKLIENILEDENNSLLNNVFNIGRASESLALRNPDYYDRYFSYHLGNRTPNFIFENTIQTLKNGSSTDESLDKLFDFDDVYYKLLELIHNLKSNKLERDVLFLLIVKNISKLNNEEKDFYGLDEKSRIIEKIAINLDENKNENNSEISINIAEIIDVHQLCYFIRKFKEEKQYKSKLIDILVRKAKTKFNIQEPVYIEPSQTAKMIMIYWKKQEADSFDKHIKESLTDLYKIKKLIRNFPIYMIDSFMYGGLLDRDYKFMKEMLDVKFIFNKIKKIDKKIIEKVDVNNFYNIDETSEYSEDENLEQFIYWHLMEDNNYKMLLISK